MESNWYVYFLSICFLLDFKKSTTKPQKTLETLKSWRSQSLITENAEEPLFFREFTFQIGSNSEKLTGPIEM